MASIIKKLINGILGDVVQLDHSAQDIDDSITKTSQLTGRNLLDNWYFADPINQRGQTEYSLAYSYGLDRWIQNGITVTNTGDVIAISGGIGDDKIYQLLEDTSLASKTVSLSVLYGGVLTTLTGVPNTSPSKLGSNCALYLGLVGGRPYCQFSPTTTGQIVAIKLELGTQQTLARKASGDTWTLIDPPPNKAEELAKCQRYCLVVAPNNSYGPSGNGMVYTTTSARVIIPTPVSLRVNPSVFYAGTWQLLANGASQAVNAMSVAGSSSVAVQIDATASGLVVGQGVVMRANNDSTAKIVLSADL